MSGVGHPTFRREGAFSAHCGTDQLEVRVEHRRARRRCGDNVAFAGAGRAAMITSDNRFYVIDGRRGRTLVDIKLPMSVAFMSVIGDHYAIVSRDPSDEHRATKLHMLDECGTERWSEHLPIVALQPPVDGGADTIHVVGHGLATFSKRKLVHHECSKEPMYMTCFRSGECVLAAVRDLRFLRRSGAVRLALNPGPMERFITPPAIASDGAVWVATEKSVYIAE